MVPNSAAMKVPAIFKSRLLKMAMNEKCIYFCNWVEAASIDLACSHYIGKHLVWLLMI